MRNQPQETPQESIVDRKLRYFAYFRKSTESDERQVQSIPDQKSWTDGVVREKALHVTKRFEESMSARKTGRPVFNEMLDRIEAGEANALIAWAPDRLARNAMDGARVIELVDSGMLRHIVFATYAFENTSIGKFMLGFFFAQSKLYTDSLREVVLRGMQSKADKGIYPGWAKCGYFNHPRTKEVLPDPKLHHLIGKAYKLYATSKYSLEDISDEMFALGMTNRSGGRLAKRQVVDILTDPFYYGAFVWRKDLYAGIHKPAVSKKLWDDVQRVYADRSRPQAKWSHDKLFCGLLRCGECGAAITAERHTKRQKNGNVHTWVYYRCTKKRGVSCSQPFLREEELVAQLMSGALSIALPDTLVLPMMEQIEKWELEEISRVSAQSYALRDESGTIAAKLRRLNDLAVEEEMDRADYRARKSKLVNEKIALEAREKAIAHAGEMYWLEPLKEFVNAVWERNLPDAGGDLSKLRELFAEGGSNLSLESRKVLWDWIPPYALLAERALRTNWWRWRESNPRPERDPRRRLRPYPLRLS
jgi:site-specific DNA recombinase